MAKAEMAKPKKEPKVYYDEYTLMEICIDDDDLSYFEKCVAKGVEKKQWEKFEFENAIDLCKLKIKINTAKTEDEKKKIIDSCSWDCYMVKSLYDDYLANWDFYDLGFYKKLKKPKKMPKYLPTTEQLTKQLQILNKYKPTKAKKNSP